MHLGSASSVECQRVILCIHSVLKYSSMVFANLPRYLSLALEKVQKRALPMIFSSALDKKQALAKTGITSLEGRREQAYRKFVTSITSESVLFPLIKSKIIPNTAPYSLCSDTQFRTDRFNNFVTVKRLISNV